MKKKMKKYLTVLFGIGLFLCVCTPAHAEVAKGWKENGALHVEGRQLTDEHGDAVQLRGISTHGLAWFPEYVNEDAFAELHDKWNANVIRLALYTAESGGYCTDGNQEQLKKLVQDGVQYATDHDLYVIIDWHILSDNDPDTYKEQARSFFTEMSSRYKDSKNVLYEICNEPNGGTSWQDIKAYAEEVIPVIRANDADAVILVGTPNWSQYVDQAAADPLTAYDNVMYTLHFYAATHKDDLRNTLKNALDQKLPVFVSEYSICDASGNGALDLEQAAEWIKLLDEYQVSYVNWNLSNKKESSALLNADCNKTSGFEEEDLSPAGKWLYALLTGADATESVQAQLDAQAAENTVEGASKELSCEAAVVNKWESDGKSYFQYELKLKNTSDTSVNGWSVNLPFNGKIELSDGWNGNYSVMDGTDLRIEAKDYNALVEKNAAVQDVGFIVCGDASLAIVK